MGTYQMFGNADQALGGMMTKPPHVPVAHWGFYFNTPDVDAAVSRLTAAGGAVLNGPMQVPGGHWIVQARDPQGGFFALVGHRPNAA
jgi:predicted enzyme related to lactoylglutathione lyase